MVDRSIPQVPRDVPCRRRGMRWYGRGEPPCVLGHVAWSSLTQNSCNLLITLAVYSRDMRGRWCSSQIGAVIGWSGKLRRIGLGEVFWTRRELLWCVSLVE